MTIDEAIHIEKTLQNAYGTNKSYHEQFAEWLEELKKRRSEDYGYMADIHQGIGYRKAIDDFNKILTVEKIKEYAESDGFININNCSLMIFDITEQLKAGGENEN